MEGKIKLLFAGESEYLIEKCSMCYDNFEMGDYVESGKAFLNAISENNIDVDYIRTQMVMEEFPWSLDEMKKYDVISISDVGSNTFLLSNRTRMGKKSPNRLKLLEQYVKEGGGFLMWGGYMSYTGFQGKAFYKNTPVEKLLPVKLMEFDDRVEVPESFLPNIIDKNHSIFKGIPEKWEGWFLTYNRLIPKKEGIVLAEIEEYDKDPFLVVWDYGKGRSIASAVDCAPHGASPEFLSWKYSSTYFANLVKWAAKRI